MNDVKTKEFFFTVDGFEKKFCVNFKVELEKLNGDDKFVKFPYKALINKEYKIIEEKDNIEEIKRVSNVYYSPYSIKYFQNKKQKNIYFPGKINLKSNNLIINNICLLILIINLPIDMKLTLKYWFPNDENLGNNKEFDNYECLSLYPENIEKAKKRIENIFNNITKTLFKFHYYDDIKNAEEKDLIKEYGQFILFIHNLLDEKNNLNKKLNKYKNIFLQNTENDFEPLRKYLEIL